MSPRCRVNGRRIARGQAAVEYLLVVAVLAAVLFGPWVEAGSVVAHLAEALGRWHRNSLLLFALS